MDREQEEIQFLGYFGIFKESLSIITSWRKVFTQIILAIILPLSFILLAHIEISEHLFANILHDEDALDQAKAGTPKYAKLSDMISSKWAAFWLFKAAYFLFFLVLSLLSTSAVVYTIACIYTAKDTTFNKVIGVVPMVWKRLMVTFLWNFIIVFMYNAVALLVLIFWELYVPPDMTGFIILCLLILLYLMGFVYISVVWHLASVVSVLEDKYGIQAMIKSKALIKGKTRVAITIFLVLSLCFIGIQAAYQQYVVLGESFWGKVLYRMLCLNLLVMLILLGLVVQTVIYFVCKSYHHENIDKSSLSDHLEVYLGDYVPLKAMDVQLGPFNV